jgi:hypothetical protein
MNNPMIIIDPNGADIRFYNSDSAMIATIISDDIDENLYTGLDYKTDDPFVIDPAKVMKLMGVNSLDAIGFGIEASYTLGGGVNGGFECVYFFKGEDAGSAHLYGKLGVNVGLDMGAGGYIFAAEKNGPTINSESWEGWSSGYSIGGGAVFGGTFWSNTKNTQDLWPEMYGRETSWKGGHVGGGLSGFEIGGRWSATYYWHTKELFRRN